MAENRANAYGEDEIITLSFDDGDSFRCGIMGVFPLDGKEYIALETLDGGDDVYLYGYKEQGEDFELLDIATQEEFDRVEAEFYHLLDEPL
jgi:hypothetical protein